MTFVRGARARNCATAALIPSYAPAPSGSGPSPQRPRRSRVAPPAASTRRGHPLLKHLDKSRRLRRPAHVRDRPSHIQVPSLAPKRSNGTAPHSPRNVGLQWPVQESRRGQRATHSAAVLYPLARPGCPVEPCIGAGGQRPPAVTACLPASSRAISRVHRVRLLRVNMVTRYGREPPWCEYAQPAGQVFCQPG